MTHKINVFLLSLIIAIMPAYVFANASFGGWTITSRIVQGASLALEASKTTVINGANVVKTSTAVIAPTAAQVAKMIVRTGAVLAVDLAIKSLIGAVDYVMDPANNEVVYQTQGECTPELCTTTQKIFTVTGYDGTQFQFAENDADGACSLAVRLLFNQENKPNGWKYSSYRYVSGSNKQSVDCLATSIAAGQTDYPIHRLPLSINTNYDPTTSVEEKRISYETVAQQIIDTAESGDTKAGGYVGEVADDLLANDVATQQDVQQQLEANAKTETEEGAGEATGTTQPVDPANPTSGSELSLEFPVFCSWAPLVCEAAQKVITFPLTVTGWWVTATQSISAAYTDAKEWFKTEPELHDTALDIQQETVTDYQYEQHVSFGASCPFSPQSAVVDFGVGSFSMDYDFTIACDIASDVRPYVVSISHLAAIIYLVYAIRNGNG